MTKREEPKTRRPPEVYSSAEVAALMGAFSRRSPTGIRNKAMVATMYHAGLRVQETLDLAPADIDHQAQEIRVRHGKGDRARNVPIDTEGLAIIAAWEERRKSLGFNGHKRLFCTLKGGPIKSTSYVRDMLKRIQKRIGMEKRVHPHGLRHTYGLELAREGVPMNEIQALLGHANLADTSRYLKHPISAATRARIKARKSEAQAGNAGPLSAAEVETLRELLERAEGGNKG